MIIPRLRGLFLRINSNTLGSQIVWSRLISTSGISAVKTFIDSENKHAHTILDRLGYNVIKYPTESMAPVSESHFSGVCGQTWLEPPMPKDLLDALESLANYCATAGISIADDRFDKLVDTIVNNCSKFNDDEIMRTLRILTIFPPTDGVGSKNFLDMWMALDAVCLSRIDMWDVDKQLLVCDHWFKLNMGKVCKFSFQCTKRLGRKLKRLPPKHLVQTMFYVNMQRKAMVEMFDFEAALINVVDRLSIDEIAIMSMGFFKTETKIRNPELVDHLFGRVMKEVTTISDISLVAILKILRYSSKLKHADLVLKLSNKLRPEISRLSMLSCLHLALLGTSFQCVDTGCLEDIIERFVRDCKQGRLKDFERIAFVMGLYDFEMDNGNHRKLCKLILQEIPDRKPEVVKYMRCFPSLLNHLTICGFHDEEMISTVLDPKYYQFAYGDNFLIYRDLLCLDSFTRINLKETYTGNRLNPKVQRTCAKLLSSYVPEKGQNYKISAADKCLLEIKDILDETYGNGVTAVQHFLPHIEKADIVMAFNKTTKMPLKVASLSLPAHYSGIILSRDELLQNIESKDDVEIITFVFGGWNSYARGTEKKTGLLRMKIDQLKLIGHSVVEVPFFEWLSKTTEARTAYLKHLISNVERKSA